MAGITQNGQKRLIFIMVPQLRIADYTGFVKKKGLLNNIEDSSNNNDNMTEALNNHCDNSICLLVSIETFYITFESV